MMLQMEDCWWAHLPLRGRLSTLAVRRRDGESTTSQSAAYVPSLPTTERFNKTHRKELFDLFGCQRASLSAAIHPAGKVQKWFVSPNSAVVDCTRTPHPISHPFCRFKLLRMEKSPLCDCWMLLRIDLRTQSKSGDIENTFKRSSPAAPSPVEAAHIPSPKRPVTLYSDIVHTFSES